MNQLFGTLTIAAAAAVVGCENPVATEPVAMHESKIIGGAEDVGHPSVGTLRSVVALSPDGSMEVGTCTATLIASRFMITAAHCVGPALWNEVNFDPAPDRFAPRGAGGWQMVVLRANPAWDGTNQDVAVVMLTTAPDLPIVPLGSPPPVGSTVVAVGYGMNDFGDGTTGGPGVGTKRSVAIPVEDVTTHDIVAGVEGQGTCHGDSGGPLFSGNVLVGTVSYGSTDDCHGANHFMRVDDNYDFLARFGIVPRL